MPTNTTVRVSPRAADSVRAITSKRLRARLRERIRALAAFPRIGPIDACMPSNKPTEERRVTHVAPYGIRYRYYPTVGELYIDTITDERAGAATRFG